MKHDKEFKFLIECKTCCKYSVTDFLFEFYKSFFFQNECDVEETYID